ncbi:MAG: hypothetical protein HKO08_03580 [Erythrobacter sp.]|nr:hypothetical protein [Erythrobacter sp.]
MIVLRAFSCAVLAAAVPAAAQDDTYPVTKVFEAFRDGCGSIENQEATSERLIASGWHKIEHEDLVGPLSEFVSHANQLGQAAAAQEGAKVSELEAFENVVAGENVYIVLDEVSADGVRISGCQLYDFGETRLIAPTMGEQLLGREPDSVLDRPEIQRSEWTPGILPEHDSFKLFFVPPNSPVTEALKFSGLALMSDTVGAE